MAWKQVKNWARTRIVGALTSEATSVTVEEATVLPSDEFWAVIWNAGEGGPDADPAREIVLVTEVTGNLLTVSRGQQGTSASAHPAGCSLANVVTAGDKEELASAIDAKAEGGHTHSLDDLSDVAAAGAAAGRTLAYDGSAWALNQALRTTDSPLFKGLTVSGDDQSTVLDIRCDAGVSAQYPGFMVYDYGPGSGHCFCGLCKAEGSAASPAAAPASTTVGAFLFYAHDGTAFREIARIGSRTGASFSGADREGTLYFNTADGTTSGTRLTITQTGAVGVGTASPTAVLHLKAGTATASTAPLKLTSGTLLASPEEGAVEFVSDDLYLTIATGSARKRVVLADAAAGLTSGRVAYATTNGRLTDSSALTYDGSYLRAPGYRSSDGTAGVTGEVAVAKAGGGTRTLSFKCGLYTGYADS